MTEESRLRAIRPTKKNESIVTNPDMSRGSLYSFGVLIAQDDKALPRNTYIVFCQQARTEFQVIVQIE